MSDHCPIFFENGCNYACYPPRNTSMFENFVKNNIYNFHTTPEFNFINDTIQKGMTFFVRIGTIFMDIYSIGRIFKDFKEKSDTPPPSTN